VVKDLRTRESIAALREKASMLPSGLLTEHRIELSGFDDREAVVASALEAYVVILTAFFGSLPDGAVSLRKGSTYPAFTGAGMRKQIVCVREGKAKASKGVRVLHSVGCSCLMKFMIEETQDYLVINEHGIWAHNHDLITSRAARAAFAHLRDRVPAQIITEARELLEHGTQSAAEIGRTLIRREQARRPDEQIDWDLRDFTNALAPDPTHVVLDCNDFAEQLHEEAREW
jgi:hypothetical protein